MLATAFAPRDAQVHAAHQSATSDEPVCVDEAVRNELAEGLSAPLASIPPKFLYDELGSRLFDAICLLPEYYLTRTERAIFDTHMADIAAHLGTDVCLIEPGAGNCTKAAHLFTALKPHQYIAIDISADYLQQALAQLRHAHPEIEMHGLGMDFSAPLHLPEQVQHMRRVFFYPGSSIGNFTPAQATSWLARMRAVCGDDGGILIGVDLLKDKAIVEAAYDDALGVTAAFNLNLLRHASRLLQADVDLSDWHHLAFFNPQHSRIEMHLQAQRELNMHWQGGQRHFAKGETIHTENSYKYTCNNFSMVLRDAGFAPVKIWQDPDHWFALVYARAV